MGLMKLAEIYLNSSEQQTSGFSIEDLDITNVIWVTRAENLQVFEIHPPKFKVYTIYAVKKDDKFVCFLWGVYHTILGTKYFMVDRLWTEPEYRKQGIASALYAALYEKLKIKLMSDNEQSPNAKKIWDRIRSIIPTKILDLQTGEKFDHQQVPDNVLYNTNRDGQDTKRYVIVTEREPTILDEVWDKTRNKKDCMLGDYYTFTHPDVKGKWD